VIDVDGGALCPLEHQALAGPAGLVEEDAGIDGHPLLAEALADRCVGLVERVDVERLRVVVGPGFEPEHVLDEGPFLRDDVLQPIAEGRRVEQVADPDPATAGLVLVGRADAAAGRPGREIRVGLGLLLDAVEQAVVGEDDVCPFGDPDVGVEPALAEPVDLLEQRHRVHDAAVPEDPHLPPDGPGGDQRELVLLALVDHGVAGVVPALVPDDDVGGLAEDVDDAALALVAQLGADDGYGHTARGFRGFSQTRFGSTDRERPTRVILCHGEVEPIAASHPDQEGNF